MPWVIGFVLVFAASAVAYVVADNWHSSVITINVHSSEGSAENVSLWITSGDSISYERISFGDTWSRTEKIRFSAFDDQQDVTVNVSRFLEGKMRNDEQTIPMVNGKSYEIHLYI